MVLQQSVLLPHPTLQELQLLSFLYFSFLKRLHAAIPMSLLKTFPQKSFPQVPLSRGGSSIVTQHTNSSWVQEHTGTLLKMSISEAFSKLIL